MGKGMGVRRTLAVNVLFDREKERYLKQIWQNINSFCYSIFLYILYIYT